MAEDNSPLPAALHQLIGEWRTEATHPSRPGLVVHGTTTFDWLGTGKLLVGRGQTDQPEFPNSLIVIGATDGLRMHYFDDRGVSRLLEVSAGPSTISFNFIRGARGQEFAVGDPGFWQRFEGRFEDGGKKFSGVWQMSRDNVTWQDDLAITYWRVK